MLGLGNSIAHSSYVSGVTPKLLDTSGDAAAAYSLRLLNSSYGGNAVNVRRDSDNAEANIGFAGGGLDTKALSDHCGSANGFVDTWFDQSGNGNDAVQETTGNQPKIYNGATAAVMEENGKPAVTFDGTSTNLNSSTGTKTAPFTVLSVAQTNVNTGSSGSRQYAYDGGTDQNAERALLALRGNQSNKPAIWSSSWLASLTSTTTNQSLYYVLYDGVNSELGIDGNSPVTGDAGTNTFVGITIGSNYLNNLDFLDGNIQEIVLYDSDQSATATRAEIESNMNDFYSIY